ncbi:site-specific DNA-methyltransferase [Clostridium sp. CX1]|uniref:DNA-methyltransferase n=1 Tax=Clostridium sp. CX1 TaxID=2978346 RepID=UPI0021BF3F48|nr:site-specific DNA-methyltransferase [Clostridium sp. CX1]MCT8978036.1 site-specific DNA-methyltransferase [Clostridium sp. CX1]
MEKHLDNEFTFHIPLIKDTLELLKELPDESVQLVIADPPYNIDIEEWDKYENYLEWAKEWIHEVYRVLKKTGNFVLFGGFQFESAERGDLMDLVYYIRKNTKLKLVNVIIWYYKNGITARRFFANRHEEIIWFAKTNKYIFNLDDVRIKYNQETVDLYKRDKRLNVENLYKGKNPTNVWEISRLNSNSKERVGHPTQKPEKIIERIVKSMSNEGDIVLDIFAGSGISTRVCINNRRNSISCDSDPKFMKYLGLQLDKISEDNKYVLLDNLDDIFVNGYK